MRGIRTLAVAAVSTLAFAATPAHAVTIATFHGDAAITCFGCPGPRPGTAVLTVSGVFDDVVVLNAHGFANYVVNTPSQNCLATGTAQGDVLVDTAVGRRGGPFTWVRVGPHAVITMPAQRASGTATFVVTSPVGDPCGGAVNARVSGHLEGV